MSPDTADACIVEEIVVNAPAARVFDAFADPAERVKWWHVEGRFRATAMDSDLRPGGAWMMSGIGMQGRPFVVRDSYRIVQRPTLLEFTWLPDWQGDGLETIVRLEFAERDGATHVRLTHSGLASDPARQSHRGWPQVLLALRDHCVASVDGRLPTGA